MLIESFRQIKYKYFKKLNIRIEQIKWISFMYKMHEN